MVTDKVAAAALWTNCLISFATAGLILGLFAMTGSWHSLWGLILLSAMHCVTIEDKDQ